jgi:hypothetical protein
MSSGMCRRTCRFRSRRREKVRRALREETSLDPPTDFIVHFGRTGRGMSNHSPGLRMTGCADLSRRTRSAHASASWVITSNVL